MGSIVFVHGSGMRAERYGRLLETVRQGLAVIGSTATLVPCLWGDEHGSSLHAGGASFRGIIDPDDAIVDPELAAWAMAEQGAAPSGLAARWSHVAANLHFRPGGVRPLESLIESSSAFTGDIALYLSRGAPIRDAIREVVAAAEPPVTVLAHSLGGIATVDLLVEDPVPGVELVVTVATQAGFLYEIDALPSLRFGDPLPAGFPRWVNILDRRDVLAYGAQPLFAGRVVDRVVDNRAPFPLAHTAYFGNSRFYALLAGRV